MVFEDVTPIMVLGEARKIAPGKLLVHVASAGGLEPSAAADIALVALGADRKSVGAGHVVCRTHPVSADRSMRLLTDVVRFSGATGSRALWHGCVFEVSTVRLSRLVEAVALVGDGLDQLAGDLVVTIEDGRSDPHVFPVVLARGSRSSVLATVYRHAESWKLRAVGMAFPSDRTAIAAELGMSKAWPMSAVPSTPETSGKRPPHTKAPTPLPQPPGPAAGAPARDRTKPSAPDDALPPLDLARLSALERDTAAVAELLSDIFKDGSAPPPKIEVRSNPAGLDEHHTAILKAVMEAGSVSPSDFEKIARDNGQMPSGAEATVNDWSFEVVGDLAIISDGETFTFNEEMRRPIEALV